MKIRLLGTAAKEGLPAVFCECETCIKAAKLGGKDIRRRAGTIIDDNVLVDMSDDIFMHKINNNLELYKIKGIVYTHSHGDHFSTSALSDMIKPVYCRRQISRVNIYGNSNVHKAYSNAGFVRHFIQMQFNQIQDGDTFTIADKKFTAIKTYHSDTEECLLYLIEKEGKKVFFGHDSAFYPDNVYKSLKGNRLDVAILDCCHSLSAIRMRHMNLLQCVKVKQRMLDEGIADASTRFIVTHFTHNAQALHSEIEAEAKKFGIEAAYDGMLIEV